MYTEATFWMILFFSSPRRRLVAPWIVIYSAFHTSLELSRFWLSSLLLNMNVKPEVLAEAIIILLILLFFYFKVLSRYFLFVFLYICKFHSPQKVWWWSVLCDFLETSLETCSLSRKKEIFWFPSWWHLDFSCIHFVHHRLPIVVSSY